MKKKNFFERKVVNNIGDGFVRNRVVALSQVSLWGTMAFVYSGAYVGYFFYCIFLVCFFYVLIGVEFLYKKSDFK